jgi:hypothetical protein
LFYPVHNTACVVIALFFPEHQSRCVVITLFPPLHHTPCVLSLHRSIQNTIQPVYCHYTVISSTAYTLYIVITLFSPIHHTRCTVITLFSPRTLFTLCTVIILF